MTTTPIEAVVEDPDLVGGASHVLRGSAWILTSVAIQSVGQVVFWLVAAKLYTTATVGDSSALFTIALFVNYVSGMGLVVAVARYGVVPDSSSSLFTFALVYTTITSALATLAFFALVSTPETSLLKPWSSPWGLALFAGIVAGTSVAALADVCFMAARRWSAVFVRVTAVAAVRLALLAFRPLDDSAVWLFSIGAIPPAVSGAVSLLLLPSLAGVRYRLVPRPSQLGEAWRFATVNWLATLQSQIALFLVPIIVFTNVSAEVNAGFFLAWSATSFVFALPAAIAQVLLVESSRSRSRKGPRDALRLGLSLSLIAFAFSFLIGPVASRFFGRDYAEAGHLLPLLLAGCIPWSFTSVRLTQARLRSDNPGTVVITFALGLTIIVPSLLLAPEHGTVGVGVPWLGGNLVAAAVAAVVNRRRAGSGPPVAAEGRSRTCAATGT